jgi:molecular chaperone DnaK
VQRIKLQVKNKKITIEASGGLSDDEIEDMIKEAESNAEEDKQKRELVEAKNQGEALIHSSEKAVKDAEEKLTEEEKSAVEDAIKSLKDVVDGDDLASIQEKSAALSQEAMKIGEKLYQQEQDNSQQSEGGESADDLSGDDVVDADYEEVKEDK